MEIFKKLEQGTEEWFNTRLGVITGSRVKSFYSSPTTKVGRSARDTLLFEILAERDTGMVKMSGKSPSMEHGNFEEEYTQRNFEIETGKKIENVGFILSEKLPITGLSPDGIVYNKEGEITEAVELKNPNTDTHLKYVCNAKGIETYLDLDEMGKGFKYKIPSVYFAQCVHYFVVIDTLETLHFISNDDRSNFENYIRVELKRENIEEEIETHKNEILEFYKKLQKIETTLKFN